MYTVIQLLYNNNIHNNIILLLLYEVNIYCTYYLYLYEYFLLHYELDKGKPTRVLRCVDNIISAKRFNYSRASERL